MLVNKEILEYISQRDEKIQARLLSIYNVLDEVFPDAEKRISWGMPTFKFNGKNAFHFAAFNNHIGIYPSPEIIIEFEDRLTKFKSSKGAVQFQNSEELPLDLIFDMATRRKKQLLEAGK